MRNQTIFELSTDDNKYSSNPNEILKSSKKIMKIYTKWTSTAATIEFVCKISNRKKIFNEHFNLCEAVISLEEIIKSTNFEINNNSCMTSLLVLTIEISNVFPDGRILTTKFSYFKVIFWLHLEKAVFKLKYLQS